MQKAKTKHQQVIEQILSLHSSEIQTLTKKVMSVIKEMNPEFEIRGYPVWVAIGFHHKTAGYICGVFPQKDFVRLVFEWGILLEDKENILEGNGKQIRSIKIHTLQGIKKRVIQNFIAQSIDLPAKKIIRKKLAEEKMRK